MPCGNQSHTWWGGGGRRGGGMVETMTTILHIGPIKQAGVDCS